jgi:hypothetical protein
MGGASLEIAVTMGGLWPLTSAEFATEPHLARTWIAPRAVEPGSYRDPDANQEQFMVRNYRRWLGVASVATLAPMAMS